MKLLTKMMPDLKQFDFNGHNTAVQGCDWHQLGGLLHHQGQRYSSEVDGDVGGW